MSTRDADRLELLAQVCEMAELARRNDGQVARAIDDARAGYASGGGRGRQHGSPTEQAAVFGHDPARAAAADRIEAIRAAHRALSRLSAINAHWTTRATATPDDGPKGCTSCARLLTSQGRRTWSPVSHERTTVTGNLAEPTDLCRWCYERVRATGKLPSRADLKAHHEGRNVRASA